MKETHKAMARYLSERYIMSMTDEMIMRILTGFEERVEDMSKILNTEIRNNIAEINKLNEMNSRIEEAEEQIIDLEN